MNLRWLTSNGASGLLRSSWKCWRYGLWIIHSLKLQDPRIWEVIKRREKNRDYFTPNMVITMRRPPVVVYFAKARTTMQSIVIRSWIWWRERRSFSRSVYVSTAQDQSTERKTAKANRHAKIVTPGITRHYATNQKHASLEWQQTVLGIPRWFSLLSLWRLVDLSSEHYWTVAQAICTLHQPQLS